MGKTVDTISVRVLSQQMLGHTLIFAAQNAGNFAERALLAPDVVATTVLGLSGTAFCLLDAFTSNVVNVSQVVVGRCIGDGDNSGARAAAGQALLLAGSGAAVGLVIAGAMGTAASFAAGPARDAALFLALQGLALGPLLVARALIGYFAGTLGVGPRLLAVGSLVPLVVHLALAWLLAGVLSWSVTGAGLARLGAALAAVAAALVIARSEFGGLVRLIRRPDPALFWTMFSQGSVLGLQQVVASLMVLLLYLTAARAGNITSAALTLTHSGLYPFLFAFAWGSTQTVAAATAQAVGRGDRAALVRSTWLCLGLATVLAIALPWGAFAVCGRPALAWLVGHTSASDEVLAASGHFMMLLAVFFVFDFAINFLSALLRAAREQAYLLRATLAAATVFGLLLVLLPARPGATLVMGTFITAQAVWAVVLLIRVATGWPGTALDRSRATPGHLSRSDSHPDVSHTRGTCNGFPPPKHRSAAPSPASNRAESLA
jgi:Na+-driven multidrug efflux pump